MKTADLIPFILLELKESDKYGFELTKSIENKSNGNIVIKQPTLYTILKKLEKSKFITSYWEDSEIGGKRHYYKITENGLKQTLTFPTYSELLNNVCGSEISLPSFDEEPKVETVEKNPTISSQSFSIFDHLRDEVPEVKETPLPTNEVFNSDSINTSTELELNIKNTTFLKPEKVNVEEEFASSKDVSKFTETTPLPQPKIEATVQPVSCEQEILNIKPYEFNSNDIEFVEYVDLKKDKNYIKSKKTIKAKNIKLCLACIYLSFMIIACSVITSFIGRGPIFYISLILGVITLIFCPALYVYKYKDLTRKMHLKENKSNFKKQLIFSIIVELLILISCVIANVLILKNSIVETFSLNNFSNLYAPLLFGTTLFFNLIVSKILNKKLLTIN